MSYLGRVTNKPSDIRVFDVTSSTSATHTLTWTAPNEQSLIVTINGVKQHEDAYSVSGTTLTLTSALVAEDKLEVVGINDIGTTITPAQGSVDTDQLANDAVTSAKISAGTIATADIADDAVTADKLANSINTEIAANTAKVTNATHTGDVTGATALTIANDAVDIAMLSATGTASSSTFLRGDNAWAAAGGNNTPSFEAYLASNQSVTSGVTTKLTIDTEVFDTDSAYDNTTNYRFTVPTGAAGKYWIYMAARSSANGNTWNYGSLKIYKNGANYKDAHTNASNATLTKMDMHIQAIIDLSETDYIEFYAYSAGTSPFFESGVKTTYFGMFKLL